VTTKRHQCTLHIYSHMRTLDVIHTKRGVVLEPW